MKKAHKAQVALELRARLQKLKHPEDPTSYREKLDSCRYCLKPVFSTQSFQILPFSDLGKGRDEVCHTDCLLIVSGEEAYITATEG